VNDGPTLWTFFGRFHPATVHFPIAMLSIAALVEFLQIVRRKPGLSPATFTLSVVGVVSSMLATLMGWASAGGKAPGETIELHRWAGVATTLVAIGATVLVVLARNAQGRIVQAARGSLFLGMILVSIAGHWGGQINYGDSYYADAWPWAKPPPEDPSPPERPAGRIDFMADVAPILRESCFSCHGGEKSGKNGKGGLRLTTKALAMKGGDGGPCIVPFKPGVSPLYMLLVEKNPEKRMPEKAKKLPAGKIEKIRRWIEQGADWPDDYEFRK
jgi:uncharacterized membrane protein